MFQFQDCQKPGETVACLLENRQNLTVPSCKHMMTKMQAIFFSDFRLISHFLEDCSPDVNKYKCGRIPSEQEDEVCNLSVNHLTRRLAEN